MIKKFQDLNYTDFVGSINQWNVLPGSYDTLSKWKVFSNLNEKSRLLEIACTTGFSSRELAVMTNCSGVGIDISEKSVEAAQKNKDIYSPEINIDYKIADGCTYQDSKLFSHIVLGSGLGFFDDPKQMTNHIPDILEEGGYVLASPFYAIKEIPQSLVEKAKKIFNITVTQEDYKEVMNIYSDFEILFEEKSIPIPETEDELDHYCESTIRKFEEEEGHLSEEDKKIAYGRLMEIKIMSNELRPYQGYSTLVLRYRKSTYKKRCVELF